MFFRAYPMSGARSAAARGVILDFIRRTVLAGDAVVRDGHLRRHDAIPGMVSRREFHFADERLKARLGAEEIELGRGVEVGQEPTALLVGFFQGAEGVKLVMHARVDLGKGKGWNPAAAGFGVQFSEQFFSRSEEHTSELQSLRHLV